LQSISKWLRKSAIDVLLENNKSLAIEDDENIISNDLLKMIADFQSKSPEEYCAEMRRDRTWGGGPEIVALCNYLECPIHVYELGKGSGFLRKHFQFRKRAFFGSPIFNTKSPIYILSADGR
jgi:hypothetical protein